VKKRIAAILNNLRGFSETKKKANEIYQKVAMGQEE
jgi:hypothetical protein